VSSEVLWMPVGFRAKDVANNLLPSPEEVQWLTGDTNIVELQATVLWSIEDPVAFLFAVDSERESPAPLVRQAAEAVLTELIARMPIDEVLSSGKVALQHEAIGRVQEVLDRLGCGIRVSGLNVVSATAPRSVLDSFNAVQTARADKERRISEANSYRNATLPRARADSARIVQEAETFRTETLEREKGEAESFRKLAAAVHASPDPDEAVRRVWLERMQRILAKGEKLVFEPAPDGGATRVFVTR
jgi:membrane protease subunit HflK